ncbi:Snf7-domain-containing protein [Apiospora marii]|uniref:Snf7-domain-containing protein n=1 Tax=Apiospora marii TaxID=335849 RepID=A0ABR1SI15_9PEZI
MSELLDYLVQNEKDFRKFVPSCPIHLGIAALANITNLSRARLPALYSDFTPLRTINPDGFNANLSAWKHGLSSALLAGHAPSRSPQRSYFILELDDNLLRSLETKQFGQPLALGTVLAEAVATNEMMPLQTFTKRPDSVYYKSWSSLGWGAMTWSLRTAGVLGQPGADGKMPKGKFVVLANLETGAKLFDSQARSRTSRFERTFSKPHFRRAFEDLLGEGKPMSEADFEVLLTFLSRDKAMLATDGATVKIRHADGTTADAVITQEDTAIASLKELIEDLNKQTEVLNKRIDELNRNAQEAVVKKNRVSALAALKSKKLAESNLATRYATLSQLEEVAARVEQAADNVQLVKVMQTSTTALKSLNSQVGGADKVDAVFDQLREQMGEVDEVGNIISEAGPTIDEAEVDDEFEAMLAEERKKEEEAERLKTEARQEKEAEETRRRLAELEKLGPVSSKPVAGKAEDPPTPVTAAANNLGDMSLEEPLPAE